jgi:hypothetical protein
MMESRTDPTPRRDARKPPIEAAACPPLALLDGDLGPRVEVEVDVDGRVERRNALAAGEVEAAILRTGETVERAGEVVPIVAKVNRRPGSPLVASLDRSRRDAAAVYALAVEIVAAGGTGAGGGFVEERVEGGRGASEGRQLKAVAWAERLRRLDAAIGGDSVRLTVKGDAIEVRSLIQAVAVGGLSLPRVLAGLGLKRSAPREIAMRRAVLAALGRMAAVLADAAGERSEKAVDN